LYFQLWWPMGGLPGWCGSPWDRHHITTSQAPDSISRMSGFSFIAVAIPLYCNDFLFPFSLPYELCKGRDSGCGLIYFWSFIPKIGSDEMQTLSCWVSKWIHIIVLLYSFVKKHIQARYGP
jgi:hypothetical protein